MAHLTSESEFQGRLRDMRTAIRLAKEAHGAGNALRASQLAQAAHSAMFAMRDARDNESRYGLRDRAARYAAAVDQTHGELDALDRIPHVDPAKHHPSATSDQAKGSFDEALHPRHPKGSQGGTGGEFRPKGGK